MEPYSHPYSYSFVNSWNDIELIYLNLQLLHENEPKLITTRADTNL